MILNCIEPDYQNEFVGWWERVSPRDRFPKTFIHNPLSDVKTIPKEIGCYKSLINRFCALTLRIKNS